ncbi:hypothetical protein K438DRAFT_1966676 [Mycena galopus ATCC 62051]|nr:hypothetical protein K438DRAFT_1966676 [Mycena galopus ATCC 62051]
MSDCDWADFSDIPRNSDLDYLRPPLDADADYEPMPSQKDEIIRNRRRRQDKLEAMREEHKYEVSSEVEGQESSLQDGQTGPQHNSSLANHAEDSVSGEVEGQESSLQDGQTGPQHNSSLANHAEDSVSGEVEGQESSLQGSEDFQDAVAGGYAGEDLCGVLEIRWRHAAGRGQRTGRGSTVVGGWDGTCLLPKAQARWTTRAIGSMHLNERHVPQNSGLVVIVSPAWRGGASCEQHLKGTAHMSRNRVRWVRGETPLTGAQGASTLAWRAALGRVRGETPLTAVSSFLSHPKRGIVEPRALPH